MIGILFTTTNRVKVKNFKFANYYCNDPNNNEDTTSSGYSSAQLLKIMNRILKKIVNFMINLLMSLVN